MNEVGGYLGRNIELVIRDDKANPDEGRRVAEDLVLKGKVDFTIGFCNTGVAMKSLDVFQDHKHLLLVPVATGSAVTAKHPAASSAQRMEGMKNLPTVAESGYPGFEALAWNGLFAPFGTPGEFKAFIDSEARQWGAIIKKVGISVD